MLNYLTRPTIKRSGDQLSWSPVFSDDAVKEVDDFLNESTTYLSASGNLNYSTTNDVLDWVLNSLTTDDVE